MIFFDFFSARGQSTETKFVVTAQKKPKKNPPKNPPKLQPYYYGAHWVDRNGQSARNKRRGPKTYHVFENEFPVPVAYEDQTYPSAFHAYQAAKFASAEHRAPLASQRQGGPRAMSLHEARSYGSSTSLPLAPRFAADREGVLEDILRAKFSSNERMLLALLRTGESEMRYDSPSPTWGFDGGSGKNMHGRVLGKLRDELRASVKQLWAAASAAEESEESPLSTGAEAETLHEAPVSACPDHGPCVSESLDVELGLDEPELPVHDGEERSVPCRVVRPARRLEDEIRAEIPHADGQRTCRAQDALVAAHADERPGVVAEGEESFGTPDDAG